MNDSINKYNDCNMIQAFINDMVGNTDAHTVIKDINEATAASKLGKTKPIFIHENNHGNTKVTNTKL